MYNRADIAECALNYGLRAAETDNVSRMLQTSLAQSVAQWLCEASQQLVDFTLHSSADIVIVQYVNRVLLMLFAILNCICWCRVGVSFMKLWLYLYLNFYAADSCRRSRLLAFLAMNH